MSHGLHQDSIVVDEALIEQNAPRWRHQFLALLIIGCSSAVAYKSSQSWNHNTVMVQEHPVQVLIKYRLGSHRIVFSPRK